MNYRKGDLVNICVDVIPKRARVDAFHNTSRPWIEFTYVKTGVLGALGIGYVRPISPLVLLAECA